MFHLRVCSSWLKPAFLYQYFSPLSTGQSRVIRPPRVPQRQGLGVLFLPRRQVNRPRRRRRRRRRPGRVRRPGPADGRRGQLLPARRRHPAPVEDEDGRLARDRPRRLPKLGGGLRATVWQVLRHRRRLFRLRRPVGRDRGQLDWRLLSRLPGGH